MYCAQCKHFGQVIAKPYGTCALATGSDGHPENPSTLAYADDSETYHAELVVFPNFGCVQFSAK